MIGVVADDLTGAAEVAGVGVRFGLEARLFRGRAQACAADLLVVDADSRCRTADVAETRARDAAASLVALSPMAVFKKTDSVLRGHVRRELQAVRDVTGSHRVILLPANPSLGRTIRNGRYAVNGVALDRTTFADDPEHPARTADVRALYAGADVSEVHMLSADDPLPETGTVIGNVATCGDVSAWAARLGTSDLPAGGSDFFAALLGRLGHRPTLDVVAAGVSRPFLVVSGSASASSRAAVRRWQAAGVAVCGMPDELLHGGGNASAREGRWADDTVLALRKRVGVVLWTPQESVGGGAVSRRLRHTTARVVRKVIGRAELAQLWIAGGATSAAVFATMRWDQCRVDAEYARGVVRVIPFPAGVLSVVLKPGSYPWPPALEQAMAQERSRT